MGHAPTYDIVNCFRGDEYLGAGIGAHDVTPVFADIALDVVTWRDAFRRLGFPPSTWQQPLTDYEQKEVDRAIASSAAAPENDPISAAFERTMLQRLNAYRAAHPALPKVVRVGGCGAGEATVTIATAPLAAQVLFIPTFFYELCKLRSKTRTIRARARGGAKRSKGSCSRSPATTCTACAGPTAPFGAARYASTWATRARRSRCASRNVSRCARPRGAYAIASTGWFWRREGAANTLPSRGQGCVSERGKLFGKYLERCNDEIRFLPASKHAA
jgi:hypothetical protein